MLDDDLVTFIQGAIRSVWALEVLLLLRRERERTWTVATVARELRANERLVSDQLLALGAAGLVACDDTCAYSAAPGLDDLVGRLEAAWRERPGAVTRAIMAAPNEKLQIFADAFRFRPDGGTK